MAQGYIEAICIACEVEWGNIDISCVQTFHESLASVELRLKVHLSLESIMVLDRVMMLDSFELYETIDFIYYFK